MLTFQNFDFWELGVRVMSGGCGVGISRFIMWSVFECSRTQCSKTLEKGQLSRIGGWEVVNLCVMCIWCIVEREREGNWVRENRRVNWGGENYLVGEDMTVKSSSRRGGIRTTNFGSETRRKPSDSANWPRNQEEIHGSWFFLFCPK